MDEFSAECLENGTDKAASAVKASDTPVSEKTTAGAYEKDTASKSAAAVKKEVNRNENGDAEERPSRSAKKRYHGISPAVKAVVISLVGIVFLLVMLTLLGVINPTALFARKKVTVPDICGLSVEDAKSKINSAGLNILVVEAFKSDETAGDVYKQRPYSQQKAVKGDVVLSDNTVYALELNVKVDGYYYYLEETVALENGKVRFLYKDRDKITFVK